MIGTGDVYFFNKSFAANGVFNANSFDPAPPQTVPGAILGLPPQVQISLVANPDPVPGTNNVYKNDISAALGEYVNCADVTQPGVPAIRNYLTTLPYQASPNCAANTFYAINNFFPGYHPDGRPANPAAFAKTKDAGDFFFIPPQNVPTIGDALIAKNIPWVYYGGGFNDAVAGKPNAFCPICNPMQYAASIYGNSTLIKQHTKDIVDFFADVANDTLPAVSFVKPSGLSMDTRNRPSSTCSRRCSTTSSTRSAPSPSCLPRPRSSSPGMKAAASTTSGFIQPVDFFGDGPRVPLMVISPFSRGGSVVHTYYDHVSITKFIERNWGLKPLSRAQPR